MTRNKLIRTIAGPVVGGGAGFLINKWITCHGGG